MDKKNGGIRPGSGRKPKYEGEKTTAIRIPDSQIPIILKFLEAYSQRKNNASILNTESIFSYELETERLKTTLAETINYLKSNFYHIPIVRHKIIELQETLETRKPIPLNNSSQHWQKRTFTPAGSFWQLSSMINYEKKTVSVRSEPPTFIKISDRANEPHHYELCIEEINDLISFFLYAKQQLS